MSTNTNRQAAIREGTASNRFMQMVVREFGTVAGGEVRITDLQRSLLEGYFVMIDKALVTAEENRIRKNENNPDSKYAEPLPVTWANVNLNSLALDAVHYARMGLDMQQNAMLYPVPYKNRRLNKYDITLMPGYNGIKYIAERYATTPPKSVTIELVYSTDTFAVYPKSSSHPVATYDFEITNPFSRGDIIGGFGYIEYDEPAKNELVLMSKADIEKRKPKYASPEFWGGEKYGKHVDGWYAEMCRKTVIREVYGSKHISVDPRKVDEDYQHFKLREAHYAELEMQNAIDANANATLIDVAGVESEALPDAAQTMNVNASTGEVIGTETDVVPNPAPDMGPDMEPVQAGVPGMAPDPGF